MFVLVMSREQNVYKKLGIHFDFCYILRCEIRNTKKITFSKTHHSGDLIKKIYAVFVTTDSTRTKYLCNVLV